MSKRSGQYAHLVVGGSGRTVVSGAGAVLLTRTAMALRLDAAMSAALWPWRQPFARHDPDKDCAEPDNLAGDGWNCLADLAQMRAQPQVFGPVASDPTVSRRGCGQSAPSMAVFSDPQPPYGHPAGVGQGVGGRRIYRALHRPPGQPVRADDLAVGSGCSTASGQVPTAPQGTLTLDTEHA